MAKEILFIDDEIVPGLTEPDGVYMWYYCEELRQAGYIVDEVWETDLAVQKLAAREKPYALIILDIMMPTGEEFDVPEAEGGLRTGVLLLDKILEMSPKTPVLILTNVANPETVHHVRRRPNVHKVLFKPDWPKEEVVNEVRLVLGG